MPVNMDPSKRRRRQSAEQSDSSETQQDSVRTKRFGEDTDADQRKSNCRRRVEKPMGCD